MIWWTEKHRAKSTRLGWLVWRWDRLVIYLWVLCIRKGLGIRTLDSRVLDAYHKGLIIKRP